jgi:hypothetical protein
MYTPTPPSDTKRLKTRPPQKTCSEQYYISGYPHLTDEDLKQLVRDHPNVTHLNLGGCYCITDNAMKSLATLTKLISLDLSYTRIRYDGLQELETLTELKHLDLHCCSIIRSDLLLITNICTKLTSLDLSYCTNFAEEGLEYLTRLTSLANLNLKGCHQITKESVFKWIPEMKLLTSLSTIGSSTYLFAQTKNLTPAIEQICLNRSKSITRIPLKLS